MTEGILGKKSALTSGWILVSGLLILCSVGTWLTAHNYRQRVFSSASGVVLENQWPESRVSVLFSESEARNLHPGQIATIRVGNDTRLEKGEVVSVTPGRDHSTVIVRVVDKPEAVSRGVPVVARVEPTSTRRRNDYLPVGAACSVTIDTTIPYEALDPNHRGTQ
jgi:hypothetical protein